MQLPFFRKLMTLTPRLRRRSFYTGAGQAKETSTALLPRSTTYLSMPPRDATFIKKLDWIRIQQPNVVQGHAHFQNVRSPPPIVPSTALADGGSGRNVGHR